MKKIKYLGMFLLLFCIDFGNAQVITTLAGGATGHGGYWGEGGLATAAELQDPVFVLSDNCNNIYIADGSSNRVLKVDAVTGIITTVAGTGVAGYNGDNIPATTAQLELPSLLAFDKDWNLYISTNDNRIRKVNMKTDTITTFVGNGIAASTGDGGPATSASIIGGGFAFDVIGNMYLGDLRKIRIVDTFGIITTIAGNGFAGITGDGVMASATYISNVQGLWTDSLGNVYFSDTSNSVRKITVSTGVINRVAGTGNNVLSPYINNIPATTCHIDPTGIFVDKIGDIYIADYDNALIEKVNYASDTITTLAGDGTRGFSGDGSPATNAELKYPEGVTFDMCGNMYIADQENYRVRKVTYPGTLIIPTITLSGASSTTIGDTVTFTANIENAGCSYLIRWYNHGSEFTTTTVPAVSYIKASGTDTITAEVVPTGSGCWDSAMSTQYIVTTATSEYVVNSYLGGNVFIYPNPATNQITIAANSNISNITITNLVGQLMLHKELRTTTTQVSMRNWADGVYFVTVTDEEGNKTVHKIVKE